MSRAAKVGCSSSFCVPSLLVSSFCFFACMDVEAGKMDSLSLY